MLRIMPWPNRFLDSRSLSTAALASVTAGLLLSYQWCHATVPSREQASTASPEMMQLLRDEHGLVATMLQAQLATEKQELRAANADRAAAPTAAARRRATAAR
jgi:hypothetical protein